MKWKIEWAKESQTTGATMSGFATSRSRGVREKKKLVWEKKCECDYVRKTEKKQKQKERESPRSLDTKDQCMQPQSVHHTGLSGAIQNSSEARPCSSGPQAEGPGQAHHWAPSCVPPPALQHGPATMDHSSLFTLQEDPVCQSILKSASVWMRCLIKTNRQAGTQTHQIAGLQSGQMGLGLKSSPQVYWWTFPTKAVKRPLRAAA